MTREYFTNEFLKHIQTTDSIMSTRGYKELCQEVLDTRAEIDRLIDNNAKFQEMATRKMTDLRADLARRDEQTTKHLEWMAEQGNTITGLRNELKDRDEKIYELLKVYGECKDAIARRDEIIARLKEDAERLVGHAVWVGKFLGMKDCIFCGKRAKGKNEIEHTFLCPITLHRALMKELE